MKKVFTDQEQVAETAETLPKYDLSGGVRGKYARDFRQGYTVKVRRKDGTTEVRKEEGTSLFRDYGYLSREAQAFATEIEARHSDYFELFYRASCFAQRVLLDLHVPVKDKQKVVVAGLMARLVEDSQGCALLVKHGLANTSAVTLRSSFESLVYLKSCCTDGAFVARFLDNEVLRLLKLSRVAQKDPSLDKEQAKKLKLREAELETEKKARAIQELRVDAVAREAEMEDYYDSIYRLTSSHVHVGPGSLEGYYRFGHGKIKSLVFGANDTLTDVYLYTLSDFLLMGTSWTCRLFGLNREGLVSEIRAELEKLSPEWPEGLDEQ